MALPVPSLAEGGKRMSTYEEFMIILTVGLLIVAVLNLKNKKKPFLSLLAKVGTAISIVTMIVRRNG